MNLPNWLQTIIMAFLLCGGMAATYAGIMERIGRVDTKVDDMKSDVARIDSNLTRIMLHDYAGFGP